MYTASLIDSIASFYQVLQPSDNVFVLCELWTRWLHLQNSCDSDSDTELAFQFAYDTL